MQNQLLQYVIVEEFHINILMQKFLQSVTVDTSNKSLATNNDSMEIGEQGIVNNNMIVKDKQKANDTEKEKEIDKETEGHREKANEIEKEIEKGKETEKDQEESSQ